MNQISILIVDDHLIVRESLRAILTFARDIVISGEAHDGRMAVRLAAEREPDVILMDIAMPGLNGIEATRQILRAQPRAKIIVLSAHGDPAYVLRALKAGAVGYLVKAASGHALAEAIREAHQGQAFFWPSISTPSSGASAVPAVRHWNPPPAALSPRACEVIQLIAEGFTTKQMAGELGIAEKTVEKHRQRVMQILDLHNIASLTRYALAHGIIEGAPLAPAQLASA